MPKTLVCWIGLTDLKCSRGDEEGLGPIGQAVKQHDYDSVELLSNSPKKDGAAYAEWLGTLTVATINIHQVKISSPMHFGEGFEAADEVVGKVLSSGARQLESGAAMKYRQETLEFL